MRTTSRFKQRGIFGAILPALGGLFGASTAVSTGLGIAGSLLDRSDARNAQEDANEFNSAQAQASRDWQERMSNTSFQRRMTDLREAGLNPMLAISQGGANVGGGASASFTPVQAGLISSAAATRQAGAAEFQSETSARAVNVNEKQVNAIVDKTKQEISNMVSVQQQVHQITDNLRQEYQNLVKQGLNLTDIGNQLRKTMDKMDAEIELINKQAVTETFRTLLTQTQEIQAANLSDKYRNEAKLLGIDVNAGENLGANSGSLKVFIDLLRVITRK